MGVTLSDVEMTELALALDVYLSELRFELSRVKLESMRHELVVREAVLTALRARMAESRRTALEQQPL